MPLIFCHIAIRKQARPLKRVVDVWDRNGSTIGQTLRQLDDDDDEQSKKNILKEIHLKKTLYLAKREQNEIGRTP
jgi:hypothetical protein